MKLYKRPPLPKPPPTRKVKLNPDGIKQFEINKQTTLNLLDLDLILLHHFPEASFETIVSANKAIQILLT